MIDTLLTLMFREEWRNLPAIDEANRDAPEPIWLAVAAALNAELRHHPAGERWSAAAVARHIAAA